jgi:hypothetical protein
MNVRLLIVLVVLRGGLAFSDDRKQPPHAAENCNAACMKTASHCQVACAKGDSPCQTKCAVAFSECSDKCPKMPDDPADAPKPPNPGAPASGALDINAGSVNQLERRWRAQRESLNRP